MLLYKTPFISHIMIWAWFILKKHSLSFNIRVIMTQLPKEKKVELHISPSNFSWRNLNLNVYMFVFTNHLDVDKLKHCESLKSCTKTKLLDYTLTQRFQNTESWSALLTLAKSWHFSCRPCYTKLNPFHFLFLKRYFIIPPFPLL